MFLRRCLMVAILASLVLAGCSSQEDNEFSRVDYNKDGKIIFEELIVVFPDLTVEEFLAADANHDGMIDAKEFERFREARRNGRKLAPSAETAPAPAAAAAPGAAPAEPGLGTMAEPGQNQAGPPVASQSPAPAQTPAQTPAQAPVQTPVAPPQPDQAATPLPAEPAATAAPAEAPAAAKPVSYVVVRGDSLSRIAKRFGVTQQALMAANGLKEADRLEAGASLTIPGPATAAVAPSGQPAAGPAGTSAAPADVTAFVADFFAKSAGGDINALMDLYAETVDYYNKGKSGRDIVRQDKVAYGARWPRRTYTPGPVAVTDGPGAAKTFRVTVPVAYTAARDGASSSGQAVFTFVLRPDGQGYRIVGERSVVAKRDAARP